MQRRFRGWTRLAAVAWLLASCAGCQPEAEETGGAREIPRETAEAPGPEDGVAGEPIPRCFAGQVTVEEEHRLAPPAEGCERTPSIRWNGRAHWTLREEPRRDTGWLLPRSELHTVRVEWEITQSGFEEHCVEPDPAPDLTGRTSIRRGRVVESVSQRGVHMPEAPEPAGALYHRPPPGWSPSGRPLPEPVEAPDRLRPGQYELSLPVPCTTFDAPGTRYDGRATLPSPHGVRCDFGLPIWVAFRPGQLRSEDDRTCADTRRFLDDGGRLQGEQRCAIQGRDGRGSVLSARWDLATVPCEATDAENAGPATDPAARRDRPSASEHRGGELPS